jgi:capsular polysaccharide transport system permease protein
MTELSDNPAGHTSRQHELHEPGRSAADAHSRGEVPPAASSEEQPSQQEDGPLPGAAGQIEVQPAPVEVAEIELTHDPAEIATSHVAAKEQSPTVFPQGSLMFSSNSSPELSLDRLVNRIRKLGAIFLLTVVVPTIGAILYFGLFASDVYISESRFVVRSPEKPAASGLGLLLQSAGFSNASDELHAAKDFILSRDALQEINKNGRYRFAFDNWKISIFDRFGTIATGSSFEDLYRYYRSKIRVDQDTSTSITTLTVRAYSSEDAKRFNERLLEMAEATVNKLNARGRNDLVSFGTVEVEEAKQAAREAAFALSAYRNKEGVVDPEKQAAVQLQMISKLQDELLATRTQLQELRKFAPQNPQVTLLETRAASLSRDIAGEQGKLAGGQKSLSSTAAEYQRLVLESQFADKQLAAAMASLEEAKNEARRKQAYVERIAQPSLPDRAMEPGRLRGVFATFVLGLVTWGIVSMLLAGVKEHRD